MANADKVTALSSGLIVAALLAPLEFPVIPVFGALPDRVPDGPAIAFRRAGLSTTYTKIAPANSTAIVEVWAYHSDYAQSLALAEQIRSAIEMKQVKHAGLILSSATLTDASEDFAGDKYIQILTFSLKINPA